MNKEFEDREVKMYASIIIEEPMFSLDKSKFVADEHLAFGSDFDGVKHLIDQRDSEAGHICTGTPRQHLLITKIISMPPFNRLCKLSI